MEINSVGHKKYPDALTTDGRIDGRGDFNLPPQKILQGHKKTLICQNYQNYGKG